MRWIVVNNFKISVFVTVLGCAVMFFLRASSYPESLSHLGAYMNQTLIWPALIGTLSAILWFAYYRLEQGHVPAFIIGFFMLIPVVGSGISELIHGHYFSDFEQAFLLYIGLSHVAYGLLNIREVLVALGQRGD